MVAADEATLRAELGRPEPRVVRLQGRVRARNVFVASQKTLEPASPGATFHGNLFIPRGSSSIIVRGITFTNPSKKHDAEGFDGITIRGGRDIWIDRCTFVDCADGALDITEASDRVTVSRCTFYYSSTKADHRFPMLVSSPSKRKHRIHATIARNWFAENCHERMPAARAARIHLLNNFFDCPGNHFCANARKNAQILSEANVFRRVNNPLYAEGGGRIRSQGDRFESTSGRRARGDGEVFKVPYPYEKWKASEVSQRVPKEAGAEAYWD